MVTQAFEKEGAAYFARALGAAALAPVMRAFDDLPPNAPGLRLRDRGALGPLLDVSGAIGRIAAIFLGAAARPVRALLFDKTDALNWPLAWHQDRTIALQARVDVAGFGPWSVKAGVVHAEPPFSLLASMVTLRVHLDPTPAHNAPLLIAPGSHRKKAAPADIPAIVARCGTRACLAEPGDVWAYATPILHASEARGAGAPPHRRVLQVDYCALDLPAPAQWHGL